MWFRAKRRDFPITKYFRLSEFEVSASRPDLVEPVPDEYMPNVIALAVKVLHEVRTLQGPMEVLSGYRPKKLNTAVGGATHSQHLRGEAADIRFGNTDKVWEELKRQRWLLLDAGQIIYYPDADFIHFALPSFRYPNRTFFVSKNGNLTRIQ
jgi:uncharacterized protein YcbK (DUF882 family)